MGIPRAWLRPSAYVAATFAISWTLWIAAGSVESSEVHFKVLLLDFRIPWEDLLIITGNAVPAMLAMLMAFEELSLGDLIHKLRLPRTSHPLFCYMFAVPAPIAANLLMLLVAQHFDASLILRLPFPYLFRYLAANILLAPLWEELGWRGYLLPILERRLGLGSAIFVTSFIWAAWHFALYHWAGHVGTVAFLLNFVAIVAVGITLAVLCSTTGYSLLLPILFHLFWNASTQWVLQLGYSFGVWAVLVQAGAAWILALVAWRTMAVIGSNPAQSKADTGEPSHSRQ